MPKLVEQAEREIAERIEDIRKRNEELRLGGHGDNPFSIMAWLLSLRTDSEWLLEQLVRDRCSLLALRKAANLMPVVAPKNLRLYAKQIESGEIVTTSAVLDKSVYVETLNKYAEYIEALRGALEGER